MHCLKEIKKLKWKHLLQKAFFPPLLSSVLSTLYSSLPSPRTTSPGNTAPVRTAKIVLSPRTESIFIGSFFPLFTKVTTKKQKLAFKKKKTPHHFASHGCVHKCQRFTNSAFQQDYVTPAEPRVSVPAGQILHTDQYFSLFFKTCNQRLE